MVRKRRWHAEVCKFRVALETLEGSKTITQFSREHEFQLDSNLYSATIEGRSQPQPLNMAHPKISSTHQDAQFTANTQASIDARNLPKTPTTIRTPSATSPPSARSPLNPRRGPQNRISSPVSVPKEAIALQKYFQNKKNPGPNET